MRTVDSRRTGWFIGVTLLIMFIGEALLRMLFAWAGSEAWYDANRWAKTVMLAPFIVVAYHWSGMELFGLRRRMGWKHD